MDIIFNSDINSNSDLTHKIRRGQCGKRLKKESGINIHRKREDSEMNEKNKTAKINEAKQKELEMVEKTEESEISRQLLERACKTDNYEDKLRMYNEALTLDPLYLDAWIQKGFALDRIGRSKEALACYDKALEIEPKNPGIMCLKGFAFNNLAEFEKSIECYDEVLKVNPEDAFSWYQKGSALESLGRYIEAMECYDRALEIDPTDALIREKKLRLLGLIYKKGNLTNSADSGFN
jgi:tetratricopeptide (TPR) repeat protein